MLTMSSETSIKSLKLTYQGKVRDIYAIDDTYMLLVASDRISAFDVILDDPIPGKGRVLTELSKFWFDRIPCPNHLASIAVEDVVSAEEARALDGRGLVVRKLEPIPIEAIVRGYMAGSGWKDYQQSQSICGIPLPPGLRQAERLPETLFTPSTKAALGVHDQNISFLDAVRVVGEDVANQVRELSIAIYQSAREHAAERGIIIADTKFEFGLDEAGRVTLMDEVLTPDSSRFWPTDGYEVGVSPPSFDKQFVRDYLEQIGWNKRPPAPRLPADVIDRTAQKYREAQEVLTRAA